MSKEVYWQGPVGPKAADGSQLDDFDQPITDEFIDGKTVMGPWGNMSPKSWARHGVGRLGTGYGQRYKKQSDGRWLKVEG